MIKGVLKSMDSLALSINAWRKRVTFRIGLVITIAILLAGVAGGLFPLIYGWDIGFRIVSESFQPPSLKHLFGTDDLGRDMFTRVLMGTSRALVQTTIVIVLSLFIGLFVGAITAYYKGFIEKALSYITELFLAIPSILLALVFVILFGRGALTVSLALVASWWSWYGRFAYLQARAIRDLDFIVLAKHYGLPGVYIILRHIVPNIMSPILIQALTDAGSVVIELATINFLVGVGTTSIEEPDWGLMLGYGVRYVFNYWWIPLLPGLFIVLMALGFALIGDSIYEEMHPQLKRRWRLWF
ncbi:MAG: ABC transporter permease [Sulfolobales archaeon]|nr:ABC transporter permease [Sulfolobales archaeon]